MVIGGDFIWLHLGKTGGRSTAVALRDSGYDVEVLDQLPHMHYSLHEICEHRGIDPARFERVFINIRPVHEWIQSLVNYRGLSVQEHAHVIRQGMVVEHEGHWRDYFDANHIHYEDIGRNKFAVPADAYLARYVIKPGGDDTDFVDNLVTIRSTHIGQDLGKYFDAYFNVPNIGALSYKKLDLTPEDLRVIRSRNPIWSAMELEAFT